MSKSSRLSSSEYGKQAEQKAQEYYISRGFELIESNYQYYQDGVKGRLGEVDIIVKKDDLIVFIEVKARRSNKFGSAVEQITSSKAEKLLGAYSNFLMERAEYDNLHHRFDLVAIDGDDIKVIENIQLF